MGLSALVETKQTNPEHHKVFLVFTGTEEGGF